jgi:hypothetical protein
VVKLAAALGVDCTAFADCDDVADEPPARAKGKTNPKNKGTNRDHR